MEPIIRNRQRRTGIDASETTHPAEAAEERLRVLIHEMSNLIDGSMRSLNHVRTRLGEGDDAEPGADVRVPDASLDQLGRVAATLEQMADLLRGATGRAGGPRIRSACRTTQELVEYVATFIAAMAEDRGIRLVTSLSADAAGVSAPPIESVLLNVMRNAIDAIGRGGRIDLLVSVDEAATEGEGSRLVIAVLDDGCGPPRVRPERVFEAGYTTRPGGTGIGLALSRRIVEELGGTITMAPRWPESSMGSDASRRGARVEIRLPL